MLVGPHSCSPAWPLHSCSPALYFSQTLWLFVYLLCSKVTSEVLQVTFIVLLELTWQLKTPKPCLTFSTRRHNGRIILWLCLLSQKTRQVIDIYKYKLIYSTVALHWWGAGAHLVLQDKNRYISWWASTMNFIIYEEPGTPFVRPSYSRGSMLLIHAPIVPLGWEWGRRSEQAKRQRTRSLHGARKVPAWFLYSRSVLHTTGCW